MLHGSYLIVEEGRLAIEVPARVFHHVDALKVVADGEEKGQIVAGHYVHGHGVEQGKKAAASEINRQDHPSEDEEGRGRGL